MFVCVISYNACAKRCHGYITIKSSILETTKLFFSSEEQRKARFVFILQESPLKEYNTSRYHTRKKYIFIEADLSVYLRLSPPHSKSAVYTRASRQTDRQLSVSAVKCVSICLLTFSERDAARHTWHTADHGSIFCHVRNPGFLCSWEGQRYYVLCERMRARVCVFACVCVRAR